MQTALSMNNNAHTMLQTTAVPAVGATSYFNGMVKSEDHPRLALPAQGSLSHPTAYIKNFSEHQDMIENQLKLQIQQEIDTLNNLQMQLNMRQSQIYSVAQAAAYQQMPMMYNNSQMHQLQSQSQQHHLLLQQQQQKQQQQQQQYQQQQFLQKQQQLHFEAFARQRLAAAAAAEEQHSLQKKLFLSNNTAIPLNNAWQSQFAQQQQQQQQFQQLPTLPQLPIWNCAQSNTPLSSTSTIKELQESTTKRLLLSPSMMSTTAIAAPTSDEQLSLRVKKEDTTAANATAIAEVLTSDETANSPFAKPASSSSSQLLSSSSQCSLSYKLNASMATSAATGTASATVAAFVSGSTGLTATELERKRKKETQNDSNYTKNLIKGFRRFMTRKLQQTNEKQDKFLQYFYNNSLSNEFIIALLDTSPYANEFDEFLNADPMWWIKEAKIKDTEKQLKFFKVVQNKKFSQIRTKRKNRL